MFERKREFVFRKRKVDKFSNRDEERRKTSFKKKSGNGVKRTCGIRRCEDSRLNFIR